MESIKDKISFSERHKELRDKTEKTLQDISKIVVDTAKQTNTYIIISDEKGDTKKISAKDL